MQPGADIKERILDSIAKDESGCWIWQKRISNQGYGQIWITTSFRKGSTSLAHRVSYASFHGPIPEGLQIDHLCKNRACVNPEHLEAVTAKENVRRSNAHYKTMLAKTHCPQGHAYTEKNTYRHLTSRGTYSRTCKECTYERTWRRHLASHPNAVKGKSRGQQLAERTHCGRGHEFTDDNTYRYGTGRKCKTCNSLKNKGILIHAA